MPAIFDYHCTESSCDFSAPEGWGYYMYAIDDEGERIVCPHPGEVGKAVEVTGAEQGSVEYRERTGFNYHCVCIGCTEQFERDPNRDELRCPACESSAVSLVTEIDGRPCPQCGDGRFIGEDTGAIA